MRVAAMSPMPKTASVTATLAPKAATWPLSSPASPATTSIAGGRPSKVTVRARKRSACLSGPVSAPEVTPSVTLVPVPLPISMVSENSEPEASATLPVAASRTCQYQPE
jgi:hypothetical protein